MDEVSKYNQARWDALAKAEAFFTRPRLDLDEESARNWINPAGRFGRLEGKRVLCLAGGGGQQSAAFALLGSDVTVVDLSSEQLERDELAAEKYGKPITTIAADMRDLTMLEPGSFDLVYQPYSINFVPTCLGVFRQVVRILRKGGTYWFAFANPFTMGVGEKTWNGGGYVLNRPYEAGNKMIRTDQDWVYDRQNGEIASPVEYLHTLSTIVHGLIWLGFSIKSISDTSDMHPDPGAEPGSWNHFVAYSPPWLTIQARLEN